MSESRITRRKVVTGTAVTVVGGPLLAACGGSGDSGSGSEPTGNGPLIATAEVPVGGGVIVADRNLVATQPTKGTFKVFSSTCPHQGCPVTKVVDGTIDCPCHGSRFSIEDGSATQGPATDPLTEVPFKVTGGEIVPS
ncbi:nitrite reductase/ring-hydroxylating ferredoxin subunit [Nocardioides albertanoniae]|uniref:Cytochrome bc1 complex Rieske iron-sulfur subunit n=1 Tax=Nocardioides albertanoniae TaxID=1175486 RepID=A0A543A6A7_9ACTN|nr:Rieske (2Fe-2S) protein [Nocardioides albertanoniae]TQL68131.1 nitrite reductase/ring-hydroxylating ferredoxin subunit [Nocardioides albertanoniae]